MFEVTVSGEFTATHQLRLAGGALETPHAHHWHVRVTYAGDSLTEFGVLVDFDAVRERLNQVMAGLHDRNLNELPAFAGRPPSAENVAVHVAEQLAAATSGGPPLRCVEVEEATGCIARYWPEPPARSRVARR